MLQYCIGTIPTAHGRGTETSSSMAGKAQVTFCAWGVEQYYPFKGGSKQGKSRMSGYLKGRWPGASHVSFDVRGLWSSDPADTGRGVDQERGGE